MFINIGIIIWVILQMSLLVIFFIHLTGFGFWIEQNISNWPRFWFYCPSTVSFPKDFQLLGFKKKSFLFNIYICKIIFLNYKISKRKKKFLFKKNGTMYQIFLKKISDHISTKKIKMSSQFLFQFLIFYFSIRFFGYLSFFFYLKNKIYTHFTSDVLL